MKRMNSRNENVAVFRTAGAVHVNIHIASENLYGAACEGCGWTMTSRQAMPAGVVGYPAEPQQALKAEANAHALACAEVPRDRWPGNEAEL